MHGKNDQGNWTLNVTLPDPSVLDGLCKNPGQTGCFGLVICACSVTERGDRFCLLARLFLGKTTLARHLLGAEPQGLYFSWDRREDRAEIRRANWPAEPTLVVLDELHKLTRWKRWIKCMMGTEQRL